MPNEGTATYIRTRYGAKKLFYEVYTHEEVDSQPKYNIVENVHNAFRNQSLKLGNESLNWTCTRQYIYTTMQKSHMTKIM